MIEPVSDALTTSIRPAWRAKNAMISSAMLPNVALRIPPTCGPVIEPSRSVERPTTQARPRIAAADRMNRTSGRRAGRSPGRSRGGSARRSRPGRSATHRELTEDRQPGAFGGLRGHADPIRRSAPYKPRRGIAARRGDPAGSFAAGRPARDQPLDLGDARREPRSVASTPGCGRRPVHRARPTRTNSPRARDPRHRPSRGRQLAQRRRARSSRGSWSAHGRPPPGRSAPQAAARSRSVAATRPGAS